MSISLYPLTVPPLHLTLLEATNEGRIKVVIKAVELRQAEMNGWFFIQPEFKRPMSNGPFLASLNMTMDLALRPDLVYRFNGLLDESGDATHMLGSLVWEATQPMAHPDELLRPESWLCLRVEQERPHGPTGFEMIWEDILPHMQTYKLGPDSLDAADIQDLLSKKQETADPIPIQSLPKDASPVPVTGPPASLMDAVSQFLTEKNLKPTREGNHTLTYPFRGKNGAWNGLAKVFEEDGIVGFYSSFPGKVQNGDLDAIEAWINHTNQELMIGNFEFDVLSGEVRFRTSTEVQQGSIPMFQLERSWRKNVETFDAFYAEVGRLVDQGS